MHPCGVEGWAVLWLEIRGKMEIHPLSFDIPLRGTGAQDERVDFLFKRKYWLPIILEDNREIMNFSSR